MYVYFITPDYLRKNTVIGDNVDSTIIGALIKTSADTFVRTYLGTYFYNDLITKYNSQSLSADEVTLVQDYIQSAVAWRAVAESIISTTYEIKNKGVQQQSGEYSNAPEFRVIPFVHDQYKDKADFYDNRLVEYLKRNKDLYPVFLSDANYDSRIKATCCSSKPDTFQSGILFI